MKNNNALIIGLILILFMVFQTLNNYHQRRILDEIRKDYIKVEETLIRKSDSLLHHIKLERKYTDSLINITKEKQVKIYNNYYEKEKDYNYITERNDSLSWFVAKREYERREL